MKIFLDNVFVIKNRKLRNATNGLNTEMEKRRRQGVIFHPYVHYTVQTKFSCLSFLHVYSSVICNLFCSSSVNCSLVGGFLTFSFFFKN